MLQRWLCIAGILLQVVFFLSPAKAARVVALDSDNGYAAGVLDRVLKKWDPPAIRGSFTVQVRASLDEKGQVLSCRSIKRSKLEAFDNVACSAVYKAAPFGATPYAAPLDIYLAFHCGEEDKKPHQELSEVDSLRAEVKARQKMENLIAAEKASRTEEEAMLRAQKAAQSKGTTLPDMKAKPAAAQHPRVAGALQEPVKAKPAATQTPKNDKTGEPVKPASNVKEDDQDSYVQKVGTYLSERIVLPKTVPQGSYRAKVRLQLSAKGKILSFQIVQSSGNNAVNMHIQRGINGVGVVPPPPKNANRLPTVVIQLKSGS